MDHFSNSLGGGAVGQWAHSRGLGKVWEVKMDDQRSGLSQELGDECVKAKRTIARGRPLFFFPQLAVCWFGVHSDK